jgi:hypothetical protein
VGEVRRALLIGAVLGAVLLTAPAAHAGGLGAPFVTLTGSCSAGGEADLTSGPVGADHPNVVEQLVAGGGPGIGDSEAFGTGDVMYGNTAGLAAGDVFGDGVSCPDATSAVPFTLRLFDVPPVPVTYDGRMSVPTQHSLPFVAPGTAQYVADVSVSQGAVSICETDCTEITGTQTVAMGAQDAGYATLDLEAGDESGPLPAAYHVTIRPLPVSLNGLFLDPSLVRPPTPLSASFGADGDTTVTATVTDAHGAAVRTVATGLPVHAGQQRTLHWNGLDAAGHQPADGRYTLTVHSTDAAGLTSTATTSTVIDSTPPTAVVHQPAGRTGRLRVRVADAGGMTGAPLLSAGGRRVFAPPGYRSLTLRAPSGGWTHGLHARLQVGDSIGNLLKKRFPVRPGGAALRLHANPHALACPGAESRDGAWFTGDIATRRGGVSCLVAQRVALGSEHHRHWSRDGFSCRRTRVRKVSGPPISVFRCRGPGRVPLRFSASQI